MRRVSQFADDEKNTLTQTYLIVRAEGQEEPGAHWHIDSEVSYVARDVLAQDIPWVGVMEDGELVEYQTTNRPLTAEQLASMPRREMDCLDCHNRATHQFPRPERSVNEALADGRLDRSLPFLKREATTLLTALYATQTEALQAITGLEQFYRQEFPEVFAAKQLSIEQAVAELQIIYNDTIFPDMNLTWSSYPDNLGHADFPGCFRCHDGQHLNEQGESIPLECDTCHSLPVVIKGDQGPVTLSIQELAAQAEGIPSIPHLVDEKTEACLHCHGESGLKPVPITHQAVQGLLNEPCLLCHSAERDMAATAIPHAQEGLEDCLACHVGGPVKPVPPDHAERSSESCLLCHRPQ